MGKESLMGWVLLGLVRMSDRIVHQGSDCKDATYMYTNLKSANCKVQLHLVPAEVIEISTQAMLSKVDLKPVPGTVKSHQIVATSST